MTKARGQLRAAHIGALIVIGGNGSLAGARALTAGDSPCQIIGLPASIDSDIGHTDLCIGVDTAVNTIVEACDQSPIPPAPIGARSCWRSWVGIADSSQCAQGSPLGRTRLLFGEDRMLEDG